MLGVSPKPACLLSSLFAFTAWTQSDHMFLKDPLCAKHT